MTRIVPTAISAPRIAVFDTRTRSAELRVGTATVVAMDDDAGTETNGEKVCG